MPELKRAWLLQCFGQIPDLSLFLYSTPSGRRDNEPLAWNDYFNQELYLKNTNDTVGVTYHVFISPPLTNGPLFVTHHGAGASALSFALFSSQLRKLLPHSGVIAFDARGHGETVMENPDAEAEVTSAGLSLDILGNDLVDVVGLVQQRMGWSPMPDIILVGHSLGGAVVAEVAKRGSLGNAVLGYAVLDVVEGKERVVGFTPALNLQVHTDLTIVCQGLPWRHTSIGPHS